MGGCIIKREGSPSTGEKIAAITTEEKAIRNHEAQYFFSKRDFKELSKSIKSESVDGSLSAAQLKRVFTDLNIPSDDLSTPDSPTFLLLSKIRNEKKLFEVRKLSLLSILIGKGKDTEKADWLFRQYDIDASNILESSEFIIMISDIIDISAKILPLLAIGDGIGSLTKEQYEIYSNKLLAAKETIINQFFDMIKIIEKIKILKFSSRWL